LVNVVYNFRSWNISGPVPDALAADLDDRVARRACRRIRGDRSTARHRRSDAARDVQFVGHGALVVLLAAMVASKVLSPQYLVCSRRSFRS
jgi:hypothetical protein